MMRYSNSENMNTRSLTRAIGFATLLITMLIPIDFAQAIDIQSMTRLKGHEHNNLNGIGIVVGLDGTGDSTKKGQTLMRSMAQLYRHYGFSVENVQELAGTDSAAIVWVNCLLPATGVREGDRLDAVVAVQGDAVGLQGGLLIETFLKIGRKGTPIAWVSGEIEVSPENPRRGIIRGGVQMLHDVRATPFAPGSNSFTLILQDEYAGYPVAREIASRITQEYALDESLPGDVIAEVVDAKNIKVNLGEGQMRDPAAVLSHIQTLYIDPELLQLPAMVRINKEEGTIIITGDVEISDVVVTTRGLTITQIEPEPIATPEDPLFHTRSHISMGTGKQTRSAARLQDLIDAMEKLKVPFDDRVAVLRELKKAGALHARLVSE